MSDQQTSLSAAGAGQRQEASPTDTSPAGAAQGEPQQGAAQPFLTREEALTLIEKTLANKGQSIADRTAARVQKVLDAAKAKGVTLTPEQGQAVLDATAEAAQPKPAQNQAAAPSQSQSQAVTQPPVQAPQTVAAAQSPGALDPVTSKAVAILKDEFGLAAFDPEHVDTGEPEFKLLDMETPDPEKFFASVRAYGAAKKAKGEQAGDSARLPGLGSKGGPSSTPAYANQKGTQILEDYYRTHPA